MGSPEEQSQMGMPTDSGPLFVFGSLMDLDLLSIVLDRAPHDIRCHDAVLPGYARRRVADEAFPMLIKQCSTLPEVQGQLIHGLRIDDVERLVYFEGPGYSLAPVAVYPLTDAAEQRRRRISARTFLATETLTDSGHPWELTHWQRTEKPLALHIADELMRHFGRIPSEDIEGAEWDALKDRALSRLRKGEGPRRLADP